MIKKTSSALKICFLVTSLGLSSCKGLPPFPDLRPKQPLFVKNITREYKVNPETMEYTYSGSVPGVQAVDGMFCYTAEEHQKLRNWVIDINKNYSCKPKIKDSNGDFLEEE